MGLVVGSFTNDFYVLPTVIIRRGDGPCYAIEIAWLRWFVGFVM